MGEGGNVRTDDKEEFRITNCTMARGGEDGAGMGNSWARRVSGQAAQIWDADGRR